MKPLTPFLRDIECFVPRATFPEKVREKIEEARRCAETGQPLLAHDALLSAAFALAADPSFAWGDSDVAWLIRVALVSLPSQDILEEVHRLLEAAARRHALPVGSTEEPTADWEHYNAAASRAWRLLQEQEHGGIYESAIALHRDMVAVVDALLSLLIECEERVERERIASLIDALRLCAK